MPEVGGVVGLDLSLSCTGMARIDRGTGAMYTRALTTDERESTIRRSLSIARRVAFALQPGDVVFLEDYAFSAKSSSITKLAELGGVSKAAVLGSTGREPLLVTTQQMRKFLSNDNNLKKDMIPREVLRVFNHAPHTHDECVAYVIALLGRAVLDPNYRPEWWTVYRDTVVQKVTEKNREALQALANNGG